MSNAFLFPGQGSQEIGMGKELYEELPAARSLLEAAGDVLGYDLRKVMFEGPDATLIDTKYAQPAIFTCSAMHLEMAKEQGLTFDYVAGHSLGEYSALYAAGVFGFADGLQLVAKRGEAMSAQNGKGTMAAVLGLTEQELKPFMLPGAVMANLNSKTQIVISGEEAAVLEVSQRIADDTDAKARQLKVSAAFHSPQMIEAAEIMRPAIETLDFKCPNAFVVPNVTGKPTKDTNELKECLIRQITGQVRWYDSVLAIKDAGVDAFYECGHGKVLRKMNRSITLRPRCRSI